MKKSRKEVRNKYEGSLDRIDVAGNIGNQRDCVLLALQADYAFMVKG